jgi:hypothetical protein
MFKIIPIKFMSKIIFFLVFMVQRLQNLHFIVFWASVTFSCIEHTSVLLIANRRFITSKQYAYIRPTREEPVLATSSSNPLKYRCKVPRKRNMKAAKYDKLFN